MTEYVGRPHLFSETGTEGGYWAIMDEKHITPPAETPHTSVCKTCHYMWFFGNGDPEPVPSFTYWNTGNGKPNTAGVRGFYERSETPLEGRLTAPPEEDEDSFNNVWTRRGNERAAICREYGHVWEAQEPQESWSYAGLVMVQTGDRLEILGEDREVIETIDVELVQQYDQYAEGARHANGWVIHSYPTDETYDFDKWCDLFQRRDKDTWVRLIRE